MTSTSPELDANDNRNSRLPKAFSLLGVVVVLLSIFYYMLMVDTYSEDDMGSESNWKNAKSIYEFNFKDIDGVEQSMDKYRGHVLIITNVASECGLTATNYEQLGQLYEKYGKSKGLRILGFPCNQFAHQEPLDEFQIKTTTCSKHKVTFDLTSKVNVNGDEADSIWKYLKDKQGGTLGSFIKWNFTKFLIDKQGQVVKRYGPNTDPKDMEKDIQQYLNE